MSVIERARVGAALLLAMLVAYGAVSVFCGCRSVDVDKRSDGSWSASYWSYGLWTSLGWMRIEVGTNGVARLWLNDVNSDVSTNHVKIVDSSGKVIAEIVGNIVDKAL